MGISMTIQKQSIKVLQKRYVLYALNIGEFWQTPNAHIHLKEGCSRCNESHLECEVRLFLQEHKINFEQQKRFDWLGLQSLDFYLPEYNIAIECQGRQHFSPCAYSKYKTRSLEKQILLDECRKDVDFQETLGYTYSKLSELNIDAIDVMSNIKNEIKKGVEYSVNYGYYPNLEVNCNLIERQTSYGFTDTFRAEKRKYKFEIDCQIDKYIESYKEMLENEFNSIDSDNKIDNVIITGHYSSMPWITEVVEKVFNTATIHVDHQGGFAIACGIALFAKQQMKASKTMIHI